MVSSSLLELAIKCEDKILNATSQEITKLSYIRKTPSGKWKILSEKGKTLGEYGTKAEAVKRLRQIEYFKSHKKKSASTEDGTIDLTELKELSYSGIMRALRKQCSGEIVMEFLRIYKTIFDAIVANGEENPADKAMPATIVMFNKLHPLKLNQDEMKDA